MKYYFNWAKLFCLRVNHNIQHYILDGIYESFSAHNNFTLTSTQGTIEIQLYLNVILETNMFFHLHNMLRLNLNIQYIYFSSNVVKKCYLGKLVIESEHTNIKYCGIHSFKELYLASNVVNISLKVSNLTSFDTQMSYTVIDKGRIESILEETTTSSHIIFPNKIKFWLVQHETLIHYIHFKAHMMHQIQLQMSEISSIIYEVHDGPGILSDTIVPLWKYDDRRIYLASTFQCVVILIQLKKLVDRLFDTLISFNFTQKSLMKYIFLNLKNTTNVRYGNKISDEFKVGNMNNIPKISNVSKICDKFSTFCFIELFTNDTFYLQAQIKELLYIGYNSTSCSYGGLGVYVMYQSEHAYRQSHTVCSTQDNFHQHRNIYSLSNRLVLIFYSYPEYISVFTTTLTISVTLCQPKQIDICSDITKSEPFHLYHPTDSEHCFIIQIYSERGISGTNDSIFCFIDIRSYPNNVSGKLFLYNITGFFRDYFRTQAEHYRDYYKIFHTPAFLKLFNSSK